MSDVCNHNKENNIIKDNEISEHKYENNNESEIAMEPGNIKIETPENIINENVIENNNCNVTLMGENDKNDRIKFKSISKCYEEIFNENVDNIMNEINDETIGNDNENENKLDKSSDDDNDSLIVSNVTLMGHETIQ